ncbi:hypothetical protein B5C34_04475 [Pacificimonas flava]|uniref:17 kDa surface antigen n=2 Tax=Pacificimonas TaxID=1960290 RepID=A0A219B366_9SPHN|nr:MULTISPECIES: glycine zipper 2TM domain-containing protein [Pacificimonas]MBZ6377527.1 glycine zipper 2TM domain-containing protein [Pacificimonas aurantium]OWV32780.1 hypothetical protein B5C34_04475 [Pacificimonas flava]
MLKPFLIGAVAATGFAATPALADWNDNRWDSRDRYERDYRYDHRDRRADLARSAYFDGLRDGRRGARNDRRDYRAKFARSAYQQGFREGRQQWAASQRYRSRDRHHYRRDHRTDYRPVYYRSSSDYRGTWYGRDDRRYSSYERCRADNGVNTGTLAGGAIGGLLGNEIARRGDKVAGTIIGAAVGAVIGHEVGKDDDRRRYCY